MSIRERLSKPLINVIIGWAIGCVVIIFIVAIFFNPHNPNQAIITDVKEKLNVKTLQIEKSYDAIGYGYFLFIWFMLGLFALLFAYKNFMPSFICPNCFHSIVFHKLENFTCGYCKTKNHSAIELITFCFKCKSKIGILKCPHCLNDISILRYYDHEKLERKRNE